MSTILTSPITLTPEEEAQIRKEEEKRERAAMIVTEGWLQGYLNGELEFYDLCQHSIKVLQRFPERGRQRFLGEIVERAIAGYGDRKERKKGNHGQPIWLRTTSAALVLLVRENENLPVNEASANGLDGKSAFQRVVEIWRENGVTHITEAMVRNWYIKNRKK